MNILISILMGILQGLTEFLPVSSSGHLVLAQHFLGVEQGENPMFEIFLHLGTLLAVIFYFRTLIWDLLRSLLSWGNTLDSHQHRRNRTMVVYLALATLMTGIIYHFAGDWFKSLYHKPLIVSFMLLVTGGLIFISDFVRHGSIPASQMGVIRSVIIGVMQAVAIIPGISRSGSTISGALFSGVKRSEAAQFSFLLAIPAILAANLSVFSDLNALSAKQFIIYLLGFIASFGVGYLVIAVLIRLIQSARLKYFAYYCWAVGGFSIVLILWGRF